MSFMFYEKLYPELGKLFYYIAAVDGKVQPGEKESLQRIIQLNWKPQESPDDIYGINQLNLIDFATDTEVTEDGSLSGLQSFETFYLANKSKFSPAIISNILQTGNAIAGACRGKKKDERELLDSINKLFVN